MSKESVKKYLIEKFDACHDFCKRNWNDISIVLTIIGIVSIIVIVISVYFTYHSLTDYKPVKFQHDVKSTETITNKDTTIDYPKPENYIRADSSIQTNKDTTVIEDTSSNETDD